MHAPDPQMLSKLSFNYFDLVVVVWLVVGLLRGRKQGMSQELLPMLKWMIIVVAASYFYRPFSVSIRLNTGTAFDLLWANRTAYLLIALGIMLLFVWIKKMLGEKLVGSDLFGRSEYYLGMLGGMVRFACMLLVMLALMNSRIVTKEEMAATEAMQKQNLEDIRFPTYGSIQQAVLYQSFTGKLVKQYLSSILIASVTPDQLKKGETPSQKKNDVINDVLGPTKK